MYSCHKDFISDFERIVRIGIRLEPHRSPSCTFCFLSRNNDGEKDCARLTFIPFMLFVFIMIKHYAEKDQAR